MSHLTNGELIEEIKKCGVGEYDNLYCDCSEPARIKELRGAGFNALDAKKSVKDGILEVRAYKLHIDPGSENLLKEIRGYRWRVVKGITLEEPEKENDHAMDALRYAVYSQKGGVVDVW